MFTGKIITVLDDDKDLLEIINAALIKEGYQVFQYDKVDYDLFMNMANSVPDIILIDLMLSGITGDKVVNSLKKNNLLKDIPVIIMSSKDEDELRKVASSIDAVAYLKKPFRIEEMLHVIAENLGLE